MPKNKLKIHKDKSYHSSCSARMRKIMKYLVEHYPDYIFESDTDLNLIEVLNKKHDNEQEGFASNYTHVIWIEQGNKSCYLMCSYECDKNTLNMVDDINNILKED